MIIFNLNQNAVNNKIEWVVCTNVDPYMIADQRNFRAKYLQNGEKN